MAVIGIDLGTTNSLAAVWRNGRSELIPNAAGAYMTPSVVSLDEDGSILVGRAAKDRLVSHPERTASGFKRDMGTARRIYLGTSVFAPEELSSFVLRTLREDAEEYLGEPVTEAVLSVPAYFAEPQRAATKRAASLAGLKVERLINEPSAAALSAQGEGDSAALVFDFGGGTLDVSLVERFENVVSVTAVGGDARLGGRDFDRAIASAFCQDCGLHFDALSPRQKEMLLRQAEICKIALSTQEPVIMAVDDGEISASLLLTNEWMIRKCGALYRRLAAPIRKVLIDAGITPHELDDFLLVGGSSHMPSVRKYVSRFLGMEPAASVRPDTAIALGVGLCAGLKAGAAELRELILTDVCPFTLGIDVLNRIEPARPLMSPIIERNSVLPTSREAVYRTSRDNQERVEIRIYQGENRYCADNAYLGKLSLDVPPGPQGREAVRVRFTYDVNGLLEAEAVNDHGRRARLVLQDRSLSGEEAARRLRELERLKLHPREQEANRAVSARGERLYAETVGDLRARVGMTLDWFQQQMETRDPLQIARARRQAERFFDEVDAWMEDGALLFEDMEEDEEDFDGDSDEYGWDWPPEEEEP